MHQTNEYEQKKAFLYSEEVSLSYTGEKNDVNGSREIELKNTQKVLSVVTESILELGIENAKNARIFDADDFDVSRANVREFSSFEEDDIPF